MIGELYTAVDIEKRTGLSRKDLAKYEDVVPPVARIGTGSYKVYDEAGVEKWKIVALLRRLGFEKPAIRRIFQDPAFDREKAVADAIQELKNIREDCDRKILFLEEIQSTGLEDLSLFSRERPDLDSLTRWFRSDRYRQLKKQGDALQKSDEEAVKALIAPFADMQDLPPDSPAVRDQLQRLTRFLEEKIGEGTVLLLSLCNAAKISRPDSPVGKELRRLGTPEALEGLRRAVEADADLRTDRFMEEADPVVELFHDLVDEKVPPQDPQAQQAIGMWVTLMQKNFACKSPLLIAEASRDILIALGNLSDDDEWRAFQAYVLQTLDIYCKDCR